MQFLDSEFTDLASQNSEQKFADSTILNSNNSKVSSAEFQNSEAHFQEAKARTMHNPETPNERSLREFKEAMGYQPIDRSRGEFKTIDKDKQNIKQFSNSNNDNNTNNILSPYQGIKTYKEVSDEQDSQTFCIFKLKFPHKIHKLHGKLKK